MRNLIRLYREPEAAAAGAAAAVVEPPVTPAAAAPGTAAAPVVTSPGTAATTVDINTPVKPDAPAFALPDAYKDKPYLKGVDSQEKLLKMLDGTQELIGKKGPAIPKDDAPKEEWDAYYEAAGRPKTAGEYKFEGAEKADPKFLPKVQAALHEAGLNMKQAGIVWTKVNAALAEHAVENGAAAVQMDVDFSKLATETFGAQRDAVLARGKELINANISPAMKAAVEKLDNNSLIVMADLLQNIDKKYIRQDGAIKQPVVTGGTPDELRAKARGLMSEQAKHQPTSVEFVNLQKQIDGIYDNIRKSGVRL